MVFQILAQISGSMYSWLIIPLLIGAGLYFTFRTRFIQFRLLGEGLRVIMDAPSQKGQVSSFAALMLSTAARVGSGNIIGVSTAICLGGYGALFWMWVTAIVGSASAFVESVLSQIYKRRGELGFRGGPSYYIEAIFHNRALAVFFALALIIAFGAGMNIVNAYNLQSTFLIYDFYDPATSPYIIGVAMAMLLLWSLMGGARRIIHITSILVPVMAIFFILIALVFTILNASLLPTILENIFSEAFNFQSISSGLAGSAVMYGVRRGLFSNEAGMGSAPNAAAAADVSHPVKQGLVQIVSVFIDTLLICTATAMLCFSSGIAPSAHLAGALYVQQTMAVHMGSFAHVFITGIVFLFAYTSWMANLYYANNCILYIYGRKPGKLFYVVIRVLASVIVFVGGISSMTVAWDFCEICSGVMTLINLPVIILCSQKVIAATRDYLAQRRAGKNPVFRASDIGITEPLDCWGSDSEV